MMGHEKCGVRVQGISPAVPESALVQLFEQIGRVIQVVWRSGSESRFCFVQFSSSAEACTALLLDNVEFGDGMLRIDLPPPDFEFPASVNRGPAIVPLPALAVPVAQLPAIAVPLAPPPATVGPPMMMTTPLVQAAIAGRTGIAVPQQRIDEIMRTVHLGNVPTTATDADVIEFLQQIGVPVYIKFSGDASQPFRYAFVEFSDVATAAKALAYSGKGTIQGRTININPAKNPITKPVLLRGRREPVDDALKRVQAALSSKITDRVDEPDHDADREDGRRGRQTRNDDEESRERRRKREYEDDSHERDRDRRRDGHGDRRRRDDDDKYRSRRRSRSNSRSTSRERRSYRSSHRDRR